MFLILSPSYAVNQPTTNTHQATKAIVVSDHALATEVGLKILEAGGNAIDAAVAVGYALAVVQPCCGNLGGGGFMLIHRPDGQNIFLNFREKAPLAATEDMYSSNQTKDASTFGFYSVATPGTVLGLETALEKYGTMSRETVIQPAILLAEEGFILRDSDIEILSKHTSDFKKSANVSHIFLKKSKEEFIPYQPGERLQQADLAKTLKIILQFGPNAFYQGSIAKEIVTASKAQGGILSLEDFTEYQKNNIDILKPLQCYYRGYQLITSPPPSSGGIALCEALGILENYPLSKWGFHSPLSIQAIVSVMDQIFLDRHLLGDPKFVQNPIDSLLSKENFDELSKKISRQLNRNNNSDINAPKNAAKNTTHYAVVDADGNWVLVTYTLNSLFGAKVIAGNTGFFLNNEMDDFTKELGTANQFGLQQGKANKIEPGKIPLSSMCPTLVFNHGKPFLALGAAGGPKIITANLQTLLNVIDYRMDIQEAVNAPRFHCQNSPKTIQYENGALNKSAKEALTKMGYGLKLTKELGIEEAIYLNQTTQSLQGATDPRRPGGAAILSTF